MSDHKAIREALEDAAADDFHFAHVLCTDLRALLADLDEARAALTAATAGGWGAVPVKPVAYRVDWPVEAGDGMRRFYGADEWESSRGTVEFFGGVPVPLAPLPTPPKEQA